MFSYKLDIFSVSLNWMQHFLSPIYYINFVCFICRFLDIQKYSFHM